MGRKKKDMKQKMCEFAYRKKGVNRHLTCIKKSLDEVCQILNPKC